MRRRCVCKWGLESSDRSGAISELLSQMPDLEKRRRQLLQTALESREQAGATVVHEGVSMPHCRSILVDDFLIAVGKSADGVAWPDEKVRIVILFISPVKPGGPEEHSELIRHFASRLRDGGAEKLFDAGGPSELADMLGLEILESETDESGS